ncbi:MAG: hypothetical protein NTW26_09165 [bacterium]|nr:hypothetical protein [bacterium]
MVGLNICPGDYHLWRGDGWILMSNAIRYRMGDRPAVRELSWGAIKAEF